MREDEERDYLLTEIPRYNSDIWGLYHKTLALQVIILGWILSSPTAQKSLADSGFTTAILTLAILVIYIIIFKFMTQVLERFENLKKLASEHNINLNLIEHRIIYPKLISRMKKVHVALTICTILLILNEKGLRHCFC